MVGFEHRLVREPPLEPTGSTVTIRRMKASSGRLLVHGLWIGMALLWVSSLVMALLDQPSEATLVVLVGLPAADYAVEWMQTMADRVGALRGELHVETSPGHGTTVSGRLPTLSLVELRT